MKSIIRLIIADQNSMREGYHVWPLTGLPKANTGIRGFKVTGGITEVSLVDCILSLVRVLCSKTRVDAPPVQSTGPHEA